jgi:transcriptional regulator with XRE-family HTH domain
VSPLEPNARDYKQDAAYLRELLETAGLTQELAADMCGVNARTMSRWLSPTEPQWPRYPDQYLLEVCADLRSSGLGR